MENKKNETMRNSKFHRLFVDQLEDMYWAEKHLVKALPKMVEASTSEELSTAFSDHLTATENHVSRLEEAFRMLDQKAEAKKCPAMKGIVDECEEIISETEEDTMVRDAALILGAQKAEHYEIATYGSLITLAKTMGHEDVADLLVQTLEEEKEADQLLTQLAKGYVNEEASMQ